MPQQRKVTEENIHIIRDCADGKIGCAEAAQRCGMSFETMRRWASRYRAEGATVFLQTQHNSDRGFQYTNRVFYNKLKKAKMRQSMCRVAKCIDNGPMEGFWGILKRERYYGRRFTSREKLISMIENYITYNNNRRVQRNLGVLTPMEKHEQYLSAA